MKRIILFIGYDSQIENEISEYIQDMASAIYFAHFHDQAIQILDDHYIDSVVLNLRSMTDAVILRYINRYYPEIHLMVSANKEFDEIISVFNQQNYSRLQQPLKLEELKVVI
jgi:DNA-binding NtrC family response regulator